MMKMSMECMAYEMKAAGIPNDEVVKIESEWIIHCNVLIAMTWNNLKILPITLRQRLHPIQR